MQQIILDAEAGPASAAMSRRGVAATARVHVPVERLNAEEPPMATIAHAGHAFTWLAEEPEWYSDADPIARNPPR